MSLRRLLFLIAVLAYIAAELLVVRWVAEQIGWLWLIAVLAVQFAIGVAIARRAGAQAFRRLAEASRQGSLPGGAVGGSALVALGGALIAVPGFVSDLIGVLLLFPPTRGIVRAGVGATIGRRITAAGYSTTTVNEGGVTVTRLHEGQVIEGEVIERGDDDDPPPGPGIAAG